ncbi:MAG: 6-phosphogluconolactonase [Planctomycetes bacterium]|nr:6-phosphogluconolactonase [Planctomycetota bacterium]MBI3846450.1 6-phosphogluconolactonase [Planctomycetota bacterium]
MKTIVTKDYKDLSRVASILVLNHLVEDPDAVLGIPAGDTPRGLYRELAKASEELQVDFSRVRIFNIDEFHRIGSRDPHSLAATLRRDVVGPIGVPASNVTWLAGDGAGYEDAIAEAGGIDLLLLGIGANGHIAFNEPGTPFGAGLHVARLAPETRRAFSTAFGSMSAVPEEAVTLGPASLLAARRIVLLASGASKADAIAGLIAGPISESMPASILRTHPNCTVIVDRDAASRMGDAPALHEEPMPVTLLKPGGFEAGGPVLVFSPHPDDSSISCGGTIALLRRRRRVVTAICVSGHRAAIPGTSVEERRSIRGREAEREAEILGAEARLLDLRFYDGDGAFRSDDAETVRRLFGEIRPEIVIAPSDADRHPTHRVCRHLVVEAARRFVLEDRTVPSLEFWEFEGPWALFGRDEINVVVVIPEEATKLKARAIRAHRSQIDRKRYDLAAESLAMFRAITSPESRLGTFGQGAIDLGPHVEVFRRTRWSLAEK